MMHSKWENMNKISPTPWHMRSYSDIDVDIVDTSGTTIAKMSSRP